MNKTNYHCHCSYCDGKAPMEDFIKSAIESGFTSFGMSSHSPLPFYASWVLSSDAVDDYINDIEKLKKKYKGIIEIYAGMEIDYIDDDFNPASEYFQNMPLDYRIGSIHFVKTPKGNYMDIDTSPETFEENLQKYYNGDLRKITEDYYKASMRMVELGGFDFIGHCDKISLNTEHCSPGITDEKWYTNLINEYFELIAAKGLMVEINTKRFAMKGCFFPAEKYFRHMFKLDIPVVVNSDSHRTHLINDQRDTALAKIKAAGYKYVRELSGGKWIDVEIGQY